jgi:hypothetical protein
MELAIEGRGVPFPNRSQLVVVGISLLPGVFANTTPAGVAYRSAAWEDICSLTAHPLAEEVQRYFKWKRENTRTADNAVGRAGGSFHRP